MKTIITILAVVAVGQVALAVWAFSGKTSLKDQAATSSLLAFEQSLVDHLVITDGGEPVKLSKKKGQWLTEGDFPIEAGKVDTMLSKLGGLKFGLPVAISESALSRFKVAEKDFERHIQLKKSDDTLAEIYVGSGAGARKSHVRNGSQNAVYTAAIGSYDIPTSLDDWQDKGLLILKPDDVKKLELSGMTLEKVKASGSDDDKAMKWKAAALESGKTLDQQALKDAISPLINMRISKVLGKDSKPEYGLEKAELSLKLFYEAGERFYQFGKIKDTEDYALKVSDRPEFFQISDFTAKNIIEKMAKEKWLKELEVEAETKPKTEDKETPAAEGKDVQVEEKQKTAPEASS